MADDIKCAVCGGTDFYKDAGHYYCNECQTQSQDIHEHVFATPEETTAQRRTSSKRVRTAKKAEDSLTSWECYNYIILGLVEELIELGANASLKQIVRILWFKYLTKLEVIRNDPNVPPKLPAVNSKVDAGIIYGRFKVKRKRSRTPSPSSGSDPSLMDTESLRKEKAKHRRSLILAEYDEFSNTLQSEDVSLHNQSLVSLKSVSDTSSKDREKFLQYNKSAKKELLKQMTKNHLKSHCRDVDSILDCHKLSYRSFPWRYTHSPDVLSRNKVFAIIYLGLLIVKDKIQLGDLLRFIREGRLSYHEVDHFFPTEINKKNLNIKNWNQGTKAQPSHYRMRIITAEMAKCLEITKYVPRQNLVELCQRYCIELNLPDEVMGYTLNLMSKALPKLQLTIHSKFIPNYEGRVISMIMFVLKLVFGLDEVTENQFSGYAVKLNDNFNTSTSRARKRNFVWNDWMHFIHYRKLVLMQHHFPTQYLYDEENVQNSDLFVGFKTELDLKHESETTLDREAEVLKRLLEKLEDRQTRTPEALRFGPSFTPFWDYIEVLTNSIVPVENDYLIDVLTMNFREDTLDFLTKPFSYLEEINKSKRVGIKHRGANSNCKLVKINNMKVVREKWRRRAKKEVYVKLCDGGVSKRETLSELETAKLEDNISELNTKEILKNFEQRNSKSYRRSMNKLLRSYNRKKQKLWSDAHSRPSTSQQVSWTQDCEISQYYDVSTIQGSQSESIMQSPSQNKRKRETYIHYNPYDRYWLTSFNVSEINREEFNDFFAKFPNSFKLVFNECARIIEHHPKELFEEFTDVEVYLCYVANFTFKDKFRGKICDQDLKRCISHATKNW